MDEEYCAYLLRMQRQKHDTHWRVSLQNAHTGEEFYFANERELIRYLMQMMSIGNFVASRDSLEIHKRPTQAK